MNGGIQNNWTLSNALSVTRLLLAIPICLLVISTDPARGILVGLIVVAILTDLLDGYFARKFGQVTEFGKIIDPLADKIAVGSVLAVLCFEGKIPLWFLVIVLARDLLILIGGTYIKRTKGIILQSNITGKLAVTAVALLILVTALNFSEADWLSIFLTVLSMGLLGASTLVYGARFIAMLRPGLSAAASNHP